MNPKKPTEKEISLLALIAFREGEISEGRCVELTGMTRYEIRDEMKKRTGAFSPYSEACQSLEGIERVCRKKGWTHDFTLTSWLEMKLFPSTPADAEKENTR